MFQAPRQGYFEDASQALKKKCIGVLSEKGQRAEIVACAYRYEGTKKV